jgi:oligopeptide/dipeptide ABC transporter ATP-binding protein
MGTGSLLEEAFDAGEIGRPEVVVARTPWQLFWRRFKADIPSPANPPAGCRFHTRCPYADDLCRTAEPPVDQIGGSLLACHHPLSN